MSFKPTSNVRNPKFFSGLGLALYIAATCGPLGALIWDSLSSQGGATQNSAALLIPTGRRLSLLWDSLSLSLGVALGGMVLGVLVAIKLLNGSGQSLNALRWFLFLLVPLPPYIHALAWQAFADFLNPFLRDWGLSPLAMRGWGASCWVWIMALAPFAISLILIGLESVDQEIIEAGRLQHGDWQLFRGILLPLARPYILAAGSLLFILSLTDYSVASLFQMSSYALDIFAEYSASSQISRTLILSLPILLLSFLVITLAQSSLKSATLNPIWQRKTLTQRWHWPSWFQTLQWSAIGILSFQILVPFASLLFLTISWSGFWQNLAAANHEIGFTLLTCAAAACLCLPLAYALAHQLRRRSHWGWWTLVALPLAIPAPLTGIGLIVLWNQDSIINLYNTWWMPVMASLARFTPIATLIITAQLHRINPQLIEAAEILQPSRWRKIIWVRLPLIGPGLLAAGLITFIFGLGELSATLLVVPAGQSTLTIRIYNFLHYGASQTVASLCLGITLLALIFAAVAVSLLAIWDKSVSQTHIS